MEFLLAGKGKTKMRVYGKRRGFSRPPGRSKDLVRPLAIGIFGLKSIRPASNDRTLALKNEYPRQINTAEADPCV